VRRNEWKADSGLPFLYRRTIVIGDSSKGMARRCPGKRGLDQAEMLMQRLTEEWSRKLNMSTRHIADTRIILILALSLAIRLGLAPVLFNSIDAGQMQKLNYQAVEYGIGTHSPPFYPLLMRLAYSLTRSYSYWVIFFLQVAMSVSTNLLIYIIIKKIYSKSIALIASAIYAIYPGFIVTNAIGQLVPWIAFILATMMFAALHYRHSHIRLAMSFGICSGIMALMNPLFVTFSRVVLSF
jgi:hypothetical protein